ncbi:AAEL007231-PA [Aedes aegypti]|uniref:AAEL007231-PA n=2 Tax=Aedes aegypti TaxID=7159 RepID=Q172Y7_AEDAE|nr:AAEL007231-PA [Aedes aegypti]
MHEVQIPTTLESLLITRSHTRQLIIENTDKRYRYAMHTLVLVDNELSDLPRIDQLVHLKSFSIANNLLEKINLTEFGGLNELESVDLSSNRICEIVIEAVNLLSLHKLDLSQNKLKRLPQNLGQLESLETLVLHHNKLEYIEMSHLNGLTKVKVLDLRSNNLLIGSLAPVLLPALEILRLESCRLHQLDMHGIETPKLKKLHLEDNKLEYVEAFFEDVYQGAGMELFGDRNPWNCNWLQDKHPRVKFVVQQDRQTCRRFVKNVCCAGSDYATERKADRRLQVVQEQNRMIYKVLEDQQDKLRVTGGNCEIMGNRLSKIESTLGEIISLVKMMAVKIDAMK